MIRNYYLSTALYFSVFIMLFLAYVSWKQKRIPIAFKMSVLMLAASLYTVGYANEVILTNLEGIKFCLRIEYLGISFIPVLCLILIIDYTGFQYYVKRWVYGILFIIPAVTLILHYTNDWHHIFYKTVYMDYSSYFPMAYLEKGPWYLVHIAYSYLVMAACIILLAVKYRKEGRLFRRQIILISLGFCIPWAANMVCLWQSSRSNLDLTPFGFAFSGIISTWVIYRYNILSFTPAVFEKIFESMSDGVIVFDYDNRIIHFNRSADSLLPELKKSAAAHNTKAVLANYPAITEALKGSVAKEAQFMRWKEDACRVYKMKLTFINNKKEVLGKIIVLTDITASEKTKDELTDVSARLTALDTLKDRIIGIAANDIREPLDRIIHLSELLDKQELKGSDCKPVVSEIQKYVKHIFLRVENMLEYFQSKQTGLIYSPMEWKVSELVPEAVNLIKEKADNKNIRIRMNIPDTMSAYADKEMLVLVLRNLLSNAVKFTHRNGNIIVSAQEENDFIIISVKDTGIGMESEKMQLLFQDVQSIPSLGTEGETGIGLGLLLCRQIIRRNRGDIWVDSTIGEGSNFFISIPADKGRYRLN